MSGKQTVCNKTSEVLRNLHGTARQIFVLNTRKEQDRLHTYNVTLRRFACHCCCGKAISIAYWSVCGCVHVGTRARGRVHARTCM
jgi:hypothetical protein